MTWRAKVASSYHSGLKWIVKQIFPPRYIFAVLPSSSGRQGRTRVHFFSISHFLRDTLCGVSL